jgi:secondary thiamine-phosphate synthase enzyme
MEQLVVRSYGKRDIIDITKLVEGVLERNSYIDGLCHLFTPHTTCAVTTADLDPGTEQDYASASEALLGGVKFNHPHNPEHFLAHYLGAIVGPSLILPSSHGEFLLGEWQRVVLLEFDGPKDRKINISFISEK